MWPASIILYEQKKVFTWKKSSIPTGLSCYTNMATVSLFWNTDMAAMTSCEYTLLFYYFTVIHHYLDKNCMKISPKKSIEPTVAVTTTT